MKFFILIFFLVFTDAFAGESECIQEVVDAHMNHLQLEMIKKHTWNKTERRLIYQMIKKVAPWVNAKDELHAVHAFVHPEVYAGEDSSPGEIVYISKKAVKLAYVFFRPGETEQGAYFLLSQGRTPKMVGKVDDGFLDCDL